MRAVPQQSTLEVELPNDEQDSASFLGAGRTVTFTAHSYAHGQASQSWLSGGLPTGEQMTAIGLPAWMVAVLLCFSGSSFVTLGFVLQKRDAAGDTTHYRFGDIVLSPQWMAGFALIGLAGSPLDLLAFSMAPLSILSPLAGVTVAMNQMLAPCLLGEKVHLFPDLPATGLIILGTIMTMTGGAHKEREYTPHLMWMLMWEPRFLACLFALLLCVTGTVCYMCVHSKAIEASARSRQLNPNIVEVLLPAIVAGGAGSFSNIGLKGIGVLLRSGWSFVEILPWGLLAAAAALVQINYVSRGLRLYQQTIFLPIYQSMLVLMSSVFGMVFYQEYRQLGLRDAASFFMGVAGIVSGVRLFACRSPDVSEGIKDKEVI